jgi:hypothetical protein
MEKAHKISDIKPQGKGLFWKRVLYADTDNKRLQSDCNASSAITQLYSNRLRMYVITVLHCFNFMKLLKYRFREFPMYYM